MKNWRFYTKTWILVSLGKTGPTFLNGIHPFGDKELAAASTANYSFLLCFASQKTVTAQNDSKVYSLRGECVLFGFPYFVFFHVTSKFLPAFDFATPDPEGPV